MIRLFYNLLAKNGKGSLEYKKYEATLDSEYNVYNVLDYDHLEPLLQSFDVKDDTVVLGIDFTFSQLLFYFFDTFVIYSITEPRNS